MTDSGVHLLMNRWALRVSISGMSFFKRKLNAVGELETVNFHTEHCREFLSWTISTPEERNSSDPAEKY